MLHACAARFDVTKNFNFFFKFRGELNKAKVSGVVDTGTSKNQSLLFDTPSCLVHSILYVSLNKTAFEFEVCEIAIA